jgi:hypothetical protein
LQNGGEFRLAFIFQRIKPWTGSMPPWIGWARSVHRGPTAARTEGGQKAAARSPELGFQALQCAKAHRRGRNKESRTGSLARASPGLKRRQGGRATAVKARWRRCSVRGLLRRGEGKRIGERCGETRWECSPFIGRRGSAEEGWPGSLTPALMALTPLKTGEGLRGDLREGK